MDVGEWGYLTKVSGLLEGTSFQERMQTLCFVRALQTSVDELDDNGKHRNMTLLEFAEGVARVAEHRMECCSDHDEEKPLGEHITECVAMMTAALPKAPKVAITKTNQLLKRGSRAGDAKGGGGAFSAVAALAMRSS